MNGHLYNLLHPTNNGRGQIGAGIMVPPNAMKVLRQLGLADSLIRKGAIKLEGLRYLNYDDGEVLYRKQGGDMAREYGDPWWCVTRARPIAACGRITEHADTSSCIHRAEYHETLHEEAVRLGCEIRLDCEVLSVSDEDEFCSVTTKDGGIIKGDVIVGADGMYDFKILQREN
jgi:salicylate hydroxylase